ncbi:MAG: DNA primase [Candidatus Cryptobacteroides sp.]
MIPKETIQLITDTVRIEDVVGDYVSFRRRGPDLWACCPFHNEKTPSFHVTPSSGRYYCFGCHKGGTALDFMMEYEHLSYTEALRYLAKKYNIEIKEEEETPEAIARRQKSESLHLVSEYAAGFFRDNLKEGEGKAVGLEYFHSRGLEDETIRKYGLGWAPSGRSTFSDAALAAGYKSEYLLETGLCYERDGVLRDRFTERVVFPVHSLSGRVIAFGARTLKSKVEGEPYAKYVNSKESEIYVKKNSLYGIWFAKKDIARENRCYLVEGYLDVLSMHQLGILNVVASSGTALTEGQIGLIRKFTDNVTILYDGDQAGIKAAVRGIDMFLREGMNVKVVLIPDGDDPDSYSRKHTLEEVRTFLKESETDFLDFKASIALKDAGNDPLARAEAINQIADSVALIPDAIKRSVYVEHLSDRLNVRRDVLENRVMETRNKELTAASNRRRRTGGSGAGSLAADINPVVEPAPQVATVGNPASEAASSSGSSGGLDQFEENPIMAKAERDLLNFILTDGTDVLGFPPDSEFYVESEEERPTVFDFISQSLEDDGVCFTNSLYRQIYELYSEMYYQGLDQDRILRRILDGEDRRLAQAACRLSNNEPYALSVKNLRASMMNKNSWLTKYVPKAILVFQNCRLENRLNELENEVKRIQETASEDEMNAVLEELMSVQKMTRTVNVMLGRDKN